MHIYIYISVFMCVCACLCVCVSNQKKYFSVLFLLDLTYFLKLGFFQVQLNAVLR